MVLAVVVSTAAVVIARSWNIFRKVVLAFEVSGLSCVLGKN